MRRILTFAVICLLTSIVVLAGSHRRFSSVAAQDFDVCIEDDASKDTALRINSTTGDYVFCLAGKSFSGKGAVVKHGQLVILQQVAADRRVNARIDLAAKNGSASFQSADGKTNGKIRDENTADSKCLCQGEKR